MRGALVGDAASRRAALLALLAGVVVRLGVELGLCLALLTAGGLEIELLDEDREDHVVRGKECGAQWDDEQPARLVVALQDAKHEQVEEAAGECQADGDVEQVAEHVSKARKDGGDAKEQRRDKEEGELEGLGDAGEHRGEGGGEEQAARSLLAVILGAQVHGEGRTGEGEDVEDELAGEAPGARGREVRDGGVGELREEDVLGAVDHLAGYLHGTADGGLPERQIEDMVQAKRDEQALDHAKEENAHRARAGDGVTEGVDALLDGLPHEEHRDADEGEHDGGDDWHKARATKE